MESRSSNIISEDNEHIQEPIICEEPRSEKKRSMGLKTQLCVGEEMFQYSFQPFFRAIH